MVMRMPVIMNVLMLVRMGMVIVMMTVAVMMVVIVVVVVVVVMIVMVIVVVSMVGIRAQCRLPSTLQISQGRLGILSTSAMRAHQTDSSSSMVLIFNSSPCSRSS